MSGERAAPAAFTVTFRAVAPGGVRVDATSPDYGEWEDTIRAELHGPAAAEVWAALAGVLATVQRWQALGAGAPPEAL